MRQEALFRLMTCPSVHPNFGCENVVLAPVNVGKKSERGEISSIVIITADDIGNHSGDGSCEPWRHFKVAGH